MQETHMKHVRKHEQTNKSLNTQEKSMKRFRKVKIARKTRETIEKARSSKQINKTLSKPLKLFKKLIDCQKNI